MAAPTARFFRVSHKAHRVFGEKHTPFVGPYTGHSEFDHRNGRCSIQWMASRHSDDAHPNPFKDTFLTEHANDILRTDEWYCGFYSMEQCLGWFDGWFYRLHACGFVLREYTVPSESLAIGRAQTLIPAKDLAGRRAFRVHTLEYLDS